MCWHIGATRLLASNTRVHVQRPVLEWECSFNIMDIYSGSSNLGNQKKQEGLDQWEIQDPKMEVLYHIRAYFVGIFPYIGLT